MLAWVDMLSSPSVVMILAIVGVHVPPPFFLKGGFLRRTSALPDASGRNRCQSSKPSPWWCTS